MADTILSVNGVTGQAASIGAARAGQQLSKAVIERLLGSIAAAGQQVVQTPPAPRVDQVQISPEALRRFEAEQRP
ncbi:MAG: hypothetical protein RMM29_03715 [Planctomycetota bacterium]|nr:hypothetical protein [Planctomycetota bacterium]MCX8039007.1 hypothetical protein [Planctomycetota bacterium]MDW8372742.1 hypothetical protein [Planctomycetota bacterium]